MADSLKKEEIQELREEVQNYTPGSSVACPDRISFPEKMFIGLFGRTGCGKTSLINSLKYAATGRLRRSKWLQVAGQEKAGGHTMYRKLADVTKSIFVIDNRGLDDPNTEQAMAEIADQLDGKKGYSAKVNWDDYSPEDIMDPTAEDACVGHKISCAVFVFSAVHDIDMNTTALMDIVDFLHHHQGRYPVAVVTHVDVCEKSHVEKLKTVLRISGVSDVFEVANVTHDKPELEAEYQLNLLSLLERCMTDADETLIFKHYQKKDEERKEKIREMRLAEEKRLQEEEEREEERKREAERERQERERKKEEEREGRYQEAIKKVEREKQAEIRRIMEANRGNQNSCLIL
ncbi:uncharacterized protein [Diadema antillarum]|uniref:uncharacterized protein n=1 Tax=Diadema antillarum TaxID=105358 RepID=UPI003A882408